jgi:WD40 repeat protein
MTIQVWSGVDGTHIRTLSGHRGAVVALAVGSNEKLYSGSFDATIRVWSTRDGAHIQTLEGHTKSVYALLLGLNGRAYTASDDSTIRVWSGDDGAHLQTLEGHTDCVTSLVWGPEGKLCSASIDGTIRVWSDSGATIFKTVESGSVIAGLAWIDGNFFAALDEEIWMWSSDQLGPTDPPSHVLDGAAGEVTGGSSGDLYAAADNVIVKM